MNRRLLLLGAAIALAMIVSFLVGYVVRIWPTIGEPLRVALINSSVAFITWIGGIGLVLHQLNVQTVNLNRQIEKQSENTLAGSRYNEKLKLRKDVYEEADAVINDAETAQDELRTIAWRFIRDIETLRSLPQWTPKVSYQSMNEAHDLCSQKSHVVEKLIVKWAILDPRINVLLEPLTWARRDVDRTFFRFMSSALKKLPTEPGGPHRMNIGDVSNNELLELTALSESLQAASNTLNFFSHDLRIELQNLLLEELFGNRASYRAPSELVPVVLRSDRPEPLKEYVNRRKQEHT